MNNSLSLTKNLYMLANVAKKDFTFTYNNKTEVYKAPEAVYVGPAFFRKFDCQCCGWCCIRATLEYYPFTPPHKDIFNNLKEVIFEINGQVKTIYAYDQLDHKGKKCKYLKDNLCSIHTASPFNCRLEPLKMRKNKDKGYFTKAPFGRSWVKRDGKCAECKFSAFDKDQLVNRDIPLLKEMNQIAMYLGIETWIPEFLDYLNKLDYSKLPTSSVLLGINFVDIIGGQEDCECPGICTECKCHGEKE